jgi:hypothetical protein
MPIVNPRAIFLPYCIQRLEDGRYVVLNRNYKPLGFQTTEHLKYEDYPIPVRFKGLTAKKAATLSAKCSGDLDVIYLYDDGCIPTASAADMKRYLSRLEILAKMKFADVED